MENGMTFVFPAMEHKERALDYIREFLERGDEVHGSGGLDRCLRESTYEAWLDKLKRDMDIANMPEGRMPALTYFCVREADGRIAGMVNIRLARGELVPREAGHVGYSVRPAERRRGCATAMLREAVRICGVVGIDEVYVTCAKGNAASAGTILKCGGALIETFYSERYGETIERYAIPAAPRPEKGELS